MRAGRLHWSFRSVFLAPFFFFLHFSAQATHLRAGEITVTRDCSSGFTFLIEITVYTNTGSTVQFSDHGDGALDFGDGSAIFNPPQQTASDVPGYAGFGVVHYTTSHTYSSPGRYVINYMEPNRNAGILNMDNSVLTPFDIYTVIDIDPFAGCDNSPQLLVPPIDKACTGVTWFHNAGAYDPDGDSLSYQLVVPKQAPSLNVYGYENPNNQEFYSPLGIPYGTANQAKDGPPTFSIDSITGTVTWDAPGAPGQYNIAFHIIEWRKVYGVWTQLGYVTRDMQVIVEDCSNHRPQLISPADTCVVAGTKIVKDIYGTDQDFDPVEIQAYSQVFSVSPSPATVSPFEKYQSTGPPATQAVLEFTWQTACDHVKEQPYQVVFKITDQPTQNTGGVPLVAFTTWNITVVGPAPLWTNVTPLPMRQAHLKWQTYACSNAQTMQIWRRVESNPYTPPNCVTGMPGFLGYTMIAEVPMDSTQYVDTNGNKGLAPGAQYCYRLVAVFPGLHGGENALSYVSQESCLTVSGDAPIITNVSISTTGTTDGVDTVKWISPLASDINTSLFPPPYTYALYRAEGFSGNQNLTRVFPGTTPATSFVDMGNTEALVYNYRVLAYDSTNTLIDTSATASSVRLELKPHLASIELNWSASVPWDNETVKYSHHDIYRGAANSTQLSQLVLIDSVDVTQQQFHYVDSGQYNNTKLDKSQTYCYCVKTLGSYGNPKILAPLINFSEIQCTQPNDTTPPCKVTLNAHGISCDAYVKRPSASFSDTLMWKSPGTSCQAEAFSYNIYIASQIGGAFTLYAQNVRDTFFIDNNLPSFARCYKVSAVNRAGVESPLSEQFCFDNCPHYELPNVFTPGNDDGCNDFFSAYSNRSSEQSTCPPDPDSQKWARFVNAVNFAVYNRWGKEVYTFQSGGEDTIYIDWDGRDDQGRDLPAGVYYYLAQVNFNVVNPSKQNQSIKGWVQLVR